MTSFPCPLFIHFFFSLIFFLFCSSDIAVSQLIPLDSKIFSGRNDYWVSSKGSFAFGFFNSSDRPDKYSVGIRFNSVLIPSYNQTIVWVPGRGIWVGPDSFVHLTSSGDLILFDSSKQVTAWASNTSHLSVAYAELLDSGNLVLLGKSKSILWQSFQTPSDTLLPTQTLSSSQTLRAASRNTVSSYYSLSIDDSGQLNLKWETHMKYWKIDSPHRHTSSIFTNDGALCLLDSNSQQVWSVYSQDHNDSNVSFRYLRLDIDGNLRMYSWIESSKSWRIVWQAVKNQCHVYATCGFQGICIFRMDGTTNCKCPFLSDSRCLVPHIGNCTLGHTMVRLEHTYLYGIYPPIESVTVASIEKCKSSCQEDSNCMSVTVTNNGSGQCTARQTIFITGYKIPSLASISFMKVCRDTPYTILNIDSLEPRSPSPHSSSHVLSTPYIIGLLSISLCTLLVIQMGLCLFSLKWRTARYMVITLDQFVHNSGGLLSVTFFDIKKMTRNFNSKLGPSVFKGMDPSHHPVVIKKLNIIGQGLPVEKKHFNHTISIIGSLRHKNLLKMEGYCCESEHRYLVYQFAKNGSVSKWIYNSDLSRNLSWCKRMEISLCVARAINYLHRECREFITHGNLKWENVVLDEEMEAKVTEFGIRKLVGDQEDLCSVEADISAFGEMLVKLVTARPGGPSFCRWVYEDWIEGRIEKLIDVHIQDLIDEEQVEKLLRIAFWCIQDDKRLRPTMEVVVQIMEGVLNVVRPPSPFAQVRPLRDLMSFPE